MDIQTRQETYAQKIFNLIEKVVNWWIRKKCSINSLGFIFLTIGLSLLSPPFFIECFKLLVHFLNRDTRINNSINNMIFKFDYLSLFIAILFIFLGSVIIILNYFKFFNKFLLNKKIVIKQYSNGSPTFNNVLALKENYNVIEYNIDLTKFLKNNHKKGILKAIVLQDKICKKILSSKKIIDIQDFSLCSITSLPFVARLGAQLGNEKSWIYYENDQNYRKGFFKLEDTAFSTYLNVKTKKIKNNEELVLAIGITMPININVIPNYLHDCNYIYIEHDDVHIKTPNRDVIKSALQLTEYRDFIKHEILKLKGIKTIHIFYSGQTSLMFSLISSFNKNYEPYKIIVYHFFQDHYPWGIRVYENDSQKALIINTK